MGSDLNRQVERMRYWTGRAQKSLNFRKSPKMLVSFAEQWRDDRWYPEAEVNLIDSLFPMAPASKLIWVDEEGRRSEWDNREWRTRTMTIAAELHWRGVRRGDSVGIWGPPQPGMVAGMLACAAIGAIAVPMYSGFAVDAVRHRGELAGVKAWITSNRGVYSGRERNFTAELNADVMIDDPCCLPEPESMLIPHGVESNTPWLLLFTSGTTGDPKGIVWGQAGSLVKCHADIDYSLGLGPGDKVLWITDPGWTVFPWIILGAARARADVVFYEGQVTGRQLWKVCGDEGITHLGVSPSLMRKIACEQPAPRLPKLRQFASTGEPWDAETWGWMQSTFGLPMANVTGGTEVGCLFLAPAAGERVPPCSVGGPLPGMAVENHGGELVATDSWPGMTLGLWDDPDGSRFAETYFADDPGVWKHGDHVRTEGDYWWLLGRSDDTLKVHGKRIPAPEIEQIAMQSPGVGDAAAVQEGASYALHLVSSQPYSNPVRNHIAETLGRPFVPARIVFRTELPRTPSGKLRRRDLTGD